MNREIGFTDWLISLESFTKPDQTAKTQNELKDLHPKSF